MSKGARLRSQRATQMRHAHGPYRMKAPGERIEVRIVPGMTIDNPDDVAALQKWTHDELLRMAGDTRRSGVRWKIERGADDVIATIDEAWSDVPSGPIAQEVSSMRAFVAEHPADVVLVIAMAECAVPR